MKFFSTKTITLYVALLLPIMALSQTTNTNSVGTAVPFLNLTPDSRSGALGDAGVAISPDVNANYWNPAKLAFLENNNDVSLSYSPWLRNLVPDISLSYLSYAHKLDSRNSIGASLRYFNYGSITQTDDLGNNQGTYTPNEFQITGSFARKFGDEFSLGLTAGFIHSSYSSAGAANQAGQSANGVSAGISLYYSKKTQEFGNDAIFSFGTNISNIGSKISYSTGGENYFLPANLKIGIANTWMLDDFNQLTFAFDLNKLLVPYYTNSTVSVPSGVFQSFSDAPGGFSGELHTVSISPGLEYWYNQMFALRAGYFYANPDNVGGTHYVTLGVGFKYQDLNFDFSYLTANQQNSPLSNTLRFTLIASFGGSKNADKK